MYHPKAAPEWMGMYKSTVQLTDNYAQVRQQWDLPTIADISQLVGMCGNGTVDEVRVFLSPTFDSQADKNRYPVLTSGFGWFGRTMYPREWWNGTPQMDHSKHANQRIVESTESNGNQKVKLAYANKYDFNLFPTGDLFNGSHTLVPYPGGPTMNMNINDPYQLNQAFSMPVRSSEMNYILFRIQDYVCFGDMDYHWRPIRWTRPLTDSELGYKIYINDKNYPANMQSHQYAVDMYDKHKRGEKTIKVIINPSHYPSPGSDYVELPKGMLRGYVVQYILNYATENPDWSISMEDILFNIQRNPYMFTGISTRSAFKSAILPQEQSVLEKQEDVSLELNGNVLKIENSNLVNSIYLQGVSNNFKINELPVNDIIDLSSFPKGVYVVNLKTETNVITKKIIVK